MHSLRIEKRYDLEVCMFVEQSIYFCDNIWLRIPTIATG
jgi:hypothetical protein